MRHIAPHIQEILVANDASETYEVIRDEIKHALTQHPGIRAQYISHSDVESLAAELRERRERFLFLTTLGAMTNAQGETQTLDEILAAIVSSGDFTIFSMEDVYWRIPDNQLYWSEGIYDLFGIVPGAIAASYEGFMSRVHPDDRAAVDAAVQRAIRQHDSYDVVHRILRPDGEVRIVHENAEIVRDAEGEVVRMIGTVLDITAQRRSEEALRESETKLRTVIQGFPIILWMIDRDGVYVLSEGRGLESQGLKPGQMVGRSLLEHHRDHPETVRDARRALAGETFSSQCRMGDMAFEVHYSPLHDAAGHVSGAIVVATEIQGYLIARPLPEQDLPGWRATWQRAGLANIVTKARAAQA